MTTPWDNRVHISRVDKAGVATPAEVSMYEFAKNLTSDPERINRIVKDIRVDLSGNTEAYKEALTIPEGAIIHFAGIQIIDEVVSPASGSDVEKVGLGAHGTDPDLYALTGDLETGSQDTGLVAPNPLADDLTLDVCGCDSGGDIGTSDITGGIVRVVVIYDVAGTLV